MKSLTTLIEESGLSHAEIARQAGVHRTTVSRIVHGKQQMRADTAQRLASALGVPLEAVTKARTTQPAEPEVIRTTSAKIKEWGSGDTGDRQLPELVIRLIRAEIPAAGEVQGATGRETVRPGPDIKVKSPRRTRHIPQGESVWEVSTRQDVARKATDDFKGALKRFKDDTAAKQTHFVFVTTQIWTGAANWRAIKAKEKKWASISVYDATDLQAWLEEFTTVQLWFKDRAGVSNDDVEWLKTWVDRWCEAANPRITMGMVGHSVDHARRAWRSWRQEMHQGPIAVRGGSVGEATLLIQALIEDEQVGGGATGSAPVHDLEGVVVHSKGALSRLAEGRSDNLVIVPAPGLEEDAIGMANKARIALPTTRRTYGSQAVEVKREPRSGIDKCLQDLGLDPGKAAQLARASSGSPNALRRINLQQRDLSRWDLPKGLQRVAAVAGLVGTWEGHHPADIEAIRRLMKLGTPDAVDDAWQDLAMLDEPMTWIQGSLRGVNCRLDAWLRATKPYATRRIIEDYVQLTQLELTKTETTSDSEIATNDPMGADRQKENRVSTTMLDGLCKGLILLREYADEFDHLLTGSSCAGLVEQTVHAALSGTTVEHLQAISSVLPSLAGRLHHLAGPVRDRLVAAPGLVVTPGGGQHGQEGQGPHPPGPGHVGPQHQADPAQPLGLDEVAVGGADRVPIDPQGLNFGPPAPFQGLVDGQVQRSRRRQVWDQVCQQHPADDQEARLRTGWSRAPSPSSCRPSAYYRAEVTVRRPGARMTPISRIGTWRQVRASKSDAKGDSSDTMGSGRLGMMNLLW